MRFLVRLPNADPGIISIPGQVNKGIGITSAYATDASSNIHCLHAQASLAGRG